MTLHLLRSGAMPAATRFRSGLHALAADIVAYAVTTRRRAARDAAASVLAAHAADDTPGLRKAERALAAALFADLAASDGWGASPRQVRRALVAVGRMPEPDR